jgi:5-deoxy-glucuronate isomerase
VSKLFEYPEFDQTGKMVLTTTDGEFKDMLMNITVYNMKANEVKEFKFEDEEMAVLLVQGNVTFKWEENEVEAKRESFITVGPSALHVSKGVSVTIEAKEESEILVQSTDNDKEFPSKFYTPAECEDVIAGEGLCNNKAVRTVRTVFDYNNAPYSNMVLGEVIAEAGGWSSYIPHHHPQPEVYYYRFERPEGFGACFIGDHAFKVADRSFSAIPGGETHPQVAAPGYPMYYVWMIRHFEGNPWTDRIDDPRYVWLLDE